MRSITLSFPDMPPEPIVHGQSPEILLVYPRAAEEPKPISLDWVDNPYAEALADTNRAPHVEARCYTVTPRGVTYWRSDWNPVENLWERWEAVQEDARHIWIGVSRTPPLMNE